MQLDFALCTVPAHLDLVVTESTHGVNFTLAGIEAGQEQDIPIPGLSVAIPKIGNAGVDVSVELDGDLEDLKMEVGVDACAEIAKHKVCGSTLTKHLPFWVLHGHYRFSHFCEGLAAPLSVLV